MYRNRKTLNFLFTVSFPFSLKNENGLVLQISAIFFILLPEGEFAIYGTHNEAQGECLETVNGYIFLVETVLNVLYQLIFIDDEYFSSVVADNEGVLVEPTAVSEVLILAYLANVGLYLYLPFLNPQVLNYVLSQNSHQMIFFRVYLNPENGLFEVVHTHHFQFLNVDEHHLVFRPIRYCTQKTRVVHRNRQSRIVI